MAIDVELKERWVAALRSGEYKQGREALQRNGCNCCLGVLARIQNVPIVDDPYFREGDVFNFGIVGNWERDYTSAIMPPSLWSNLSYGEQQKLAEMNDGGHTFNEIATWIEGNL